MDTCDRSLAALGAVLDHADVRVPGVSAWSVGEHVQHCCLATLSIARALARSTPPPPRRLSLLARLLFVVRHIPRRRGRAPDSVLPRPALPRDALAALLDEAGQALAAARALSPEHWFEHAVFGVLPRDRALQFLVLHDRHHLAIVADILAARDRTAG